MKRCTLLIPLVMLAGCIQSQGLESEDEIIRSFEKFDELSDFVRKASSVKLYEGLPHEYWENNLYNSELASKSVRDIDDWKFYVQPVPIDANVTKQIREMMSDRTLFAPFGGPKSCGRLHSDWCLVFMTDQMSPLQIHLCFGCGEVNAYQNGRLVLRCDLNDSEQFRALLQGHRKHRPNRKLDPTQPTNMRVDVP
jgi:hypothetical protein